MILMYLILTFCPAHLPKPTAACRSEAMWCEKPRCLSHISAKPPKGWRLVGYRAVEEWR